MPEIVVGEKLERYSYSKVGSVICDELGTSGLDVAEAIAKYALFTVAASFVGGLPAIAFAIGAIGYGAQDIEDAMDEYKLTKQAKEVLNRMEEKIEDGLYPGTMYIKYEKRKWVSSNGNAESGYYHVPVKIYWGYSGR